MRWTARHLLLRRFRARPAASLLVAGLTLVAVLVAAIVPRLVEQQATSELTYQLTTIGAPTRALQGATSFPIRFGTQPPPTEGQIYDGIRQAFSDFRDTLPDPLGRQVGAPVWLVQTTVIGQTAAIPEIALDLTADPDSASRLRIVSGSAPAVWGGDDLDAEPTAADLSPVDVAISTTAAAQLKLAVGDLVGADVVDGVPGREYRVSGLFAPRHPTDLYWQVNPSLVPVSTALTERGVQYPEIAAYVAPETVGHLTNDFQSGRLSVAYPLAATGVDGSDAGLLRTQLSAAIITGVDISDGPAMPLVTGSINAVQAAVDRGALLAGLLALLAAAPLGVVFAVLVLGVQVVVRGRRPDLLLAAARGASGWQLRGSLALESALLSLPAAIVVNLLATVLIPVRAEPSGFVLPAIAALVPVALSAALAVTREPSPASTARRAQVRGIAEVAAILVAALSLFLLARRGLAQAATSVGVDPLLSVAPLLLAVSVGILVLRGYPLPMRAARRLVTRGVGLAGFIGAIRATRSPTIGLAGVLALVVGLSVSLFSAVMLTTFDAGIHRAATETVGADARIDGSSFTAAQEQAVGRVAGVRAVAGVQYLSSQPVDHSPITDDVQVLIAQTGPLSRLRSLPVDLTREIDGRVPVVVSSDLFAEAGRTRTATLAGVPVRIVGSLPTATAALGPTTDWIVADSSFASRFGTVFSPAVLFVRADPAMLPTLQRPLEKAVGAGSGVTGSGVTASGITVETVAATVTARQAEPVVVGVRVGLVLGAVLSVLLCALALVLSTVAAAAARGRTAGILRTLGMPRRRVRTLTAWELVPVAVVALVAGAVLGLALPVLLTAAIDLRPFTGSVARPIPEFDAPVLVIVLAGFALVVALAGLIAVAVGDRISPSSTLKMGES